jgi:hypothetical protein
MNKVLAEIIAGVIPYKMERNRWRGILRYGLWNAIKLRYRMKKDSTRLQYYLAVCAIAKNEGPYFKEWIEWHRKQGVEKFYIYDNESTDCTKEVLAPYIESGLVEYNYWPGQKQQLATYDDCFERHRLDTRWLAVIDLDEYIVPMKDESIPAFLRHMENFSVVEINWLCYGSGGAKTREPGNIMDRFRKHSHTEHKLNTHVKSIVDPRRVCTMTGCNEAARVSGKAVDSHGVPLTKGFRDRVPQQDVIRINHYAVKSYEEFLAKRARGRARVTTQRDMSYFEAYDLNDIEEGR